MSTAELRLNGTTIISESGGTATLQNTALDSGVSLGSNVTFPDSLISQIPRAYYIGTTYNNSTAPTITVASGIAGTLTSYGVILVSQPLGFESTEYLLDFSIVLSGMTGHSTTGSVSLNGFTQKYRMPVYFTGIAAVSNQWILDESRTDSGGVLWFFEFVDVPGVSTSTTYGISGKVISTTKPDWVY